MRVEVTILLNSRCYESARLITHSPISIQILHLEKRLLSRGGGGDKQAFVRMVSIWAFYLLYTHQFSFLDTVEFTEFDLIFFITTCGFPISIHIISPFSETDDVVINK